MKRAFAGMAVLALAVLGCGGPIGQASGRPMQVNGHRGVVTDRQVASLRRLVPQA